MNTPSTLPVIVGVDGLPGSAGALRYAIAEARRRRTSLRLVHVVPNVLSFGPAVPLTDLHEVGVALLGAAEATARQLAPDLVVDTLLTRGERTTGVAQAAEDAQLVVVGRESRRGIDRFLTGTATAGIAAHAPTTSWSCRRSGLTPTPTDGWWPASSPPTTSTSSCPGLRGGRRPAGFAAAGHGLAPARPLLRPIEARTHADDWEREGNEVLAEVTADWRIAYPEVELETRIVHGPAARVLLHASEDSDLLLISRRRLALPPFGKLGGVGHDLLRLSEFQCRWCHTSRTRRRAPSRWCSRRPALR